MRSGILVFVGALLFSSNTASALDCANLKIHTQLLAEKAIFYQEAVNRAESNKNSEADHVQALICEYRASLIEARTSASDFATIYAALCKD